MNSGPTRERSLQVGKVPVQLPFVHLLAVSDGDVGTVPDVVSPGEVREGRELLVVRIDAGGVVVRLGAGDHPGGEPADPAIQFPSVERPEAVRKMREDPPQAEAVTLSGVVARQGKFIDPRSPPGVVTVSRVVLGHISCQPAVHAECDRRTEELVDIQTADDRRLGEIRGLILAARPAVLKSDPTGNDICSGPGARHGKRCCQGRPGFLRSGNGLPGCGAVADGRNHALTEDGRER